MLKGRAKSQCVGGTAVSVGEPSSTTLSAFVKIRAFHTGASASLSSVRNGGEGRGEEALRFGETGRNSGPPLSPSFSLFVPHGARETDALLVSEVPARIFATIYTPLLVLGPACCLKLPLSFELYPLNFSPSS